MATSSIRLSRFRKWSGLDSERLAVLAFACRSSLVAQSRCWHIIILDVLFARGCLFRHFAGYKSSRVLQHKPRPFSANNFGRCKGILQKNKEHTLLLYAGYILRMPDRHFAILPSTVLPSPSLSRLVRILILPIRIRDNTTIGRRLVGRRASRMEKAREKRKDTQEEEEEWEEE